MKQNVEFLKERQIDKRKFMFEYTNQRGECRTQKPNGIKFIDTKNGKVDLLFSSGSYTYIIDKMENLSILENYMSEVSDLTQQSNVLSIDKYLSLITEFLIKKNESQLGNADAMNNSLKKIHEMLSDSNQKGYNKRLFKKYINGYKAEKVDDEFSIMILPFQSNNSQKAAIKNAMCYDVSVILGPPGTGKTQTILNIIANYIFQNKSVCVVSKNNSAIDNVVEKFEKCAKLYDFSLRMGNSEEYIPLLMSNYLNKITNNLIEAKSYNEDIDFVYLKKLYDEIQILEGQYELLIEKKNILNELLAQKRHIDRKINLYSDDKDSIQINRFFLSPLQIKREIEYLKYRKDKNGEANVNLLFKAYTKLRFKNSQIDTTQYTMYQWRLEKLYAEKIIKQLSQEIKDIDIIKGKIENKYKEYGELSIIAMNEKISQGFLRKTNIANSLLSLDGKIKFYDIKNDLLNFYPVILTTLDSVCSNIGYNKFDLVIVDETSQADIISCLPALNISKKIVFVGDTKQLSHIIDDETLKYDTELHKKYKINNNYCYSSINALDSVLKVFDPPVQLLKEHYRCDYNIINYCNKMYYNNELIIYSSASETNSMKIMSIDREKNSDTGMRNNGKMSYFNKIEEKEIVKRIGDNCNNLSIITPYAKQKENLELALPQLKGQIGTIYKFQGRENERVFLSTVLTHEEAAGKNINDETINVAVSRAEKEFVLFTHKDFFIKINHNLKYLINYIETYGEKIETQVNSIFAYLYRQIPFVNLDKCYDSLWEKKLHIVLLEVLKQYDGFYVIMKTSLADVVADKDYLIKNPDLRSFALNRNTHIDFLIVTELTEQPVLAIELDGKYHKSDIQKNRDRKKDKILEDHGIPIWRILSTDGTEKEDIDRVLEFQINAFKNRMAEFLENNSWKK